MSETPTRIGSLGSDPDLAPLSDPAPDPDLAPAAPHEQATGLEGLLETLENALKADVTFEPITLLVEKRPGVAVRYSTLLTEDDMTMVRKRSQDKRSDGGVNNLRFCSQILARQCEAFLMNGQEVHGPDGELLTFGHARIKALFGLRPDSRAADVAIKVIAADSAVLATANTVMDAAGYADEAVPLEEEEGPTSAS